ncbi:serine protease [Geomicrobium sp. JCM 19038]|uniref:S1 family peptidase n=1 Tax=Geomicrobium sp. JCM 19038 TaxID=1460635 RepID=UPI00045F1800|nr:serine protease [Geomicrobium sp. JCM 19038]GAK06738.1 hypothetical protein JCM19038_443 [Geomicrobium sp. JCM 19038]
MRPHDDDKKNIDQDNEEKKRKYPSEHEHKEHSFNETLTDRDEGLNEEGTNEEESYIDENIPPEEPPLEYFLNDEPDDEKTTKKKKKMKRWQKIGIIFVSFLLVIQGATALFQYLRPEVIDFLATSYELSQNEEVQEWRESVVTMQVEGEGQSSRGTGFFVNEDGLLATNRHVIENAFQVIATLHDGSAYPGEVVMESEDHDFALVQLETDVSVESLPIATDESFDTGTDLTIIGNPLTFTGIANEGEIIETGTPTLISAPTYSGNSGSPAINDDGEVIGIIYATRSHDDGRVGLMIPSYEWIEDVYEQK